MSQEQMNTLFPRLNRLLDLPDDDWENELSQEQYFAIVLAYNDQIRGNKREKNRQGFAGRVYPLTLDEKIVLELAYKSGKNATFDEKDIVKSLSAICDTSVADILDKYQTRKEVLTNLHDLAVQKIATNPSAKQHSYVVYERASKFLERATNVISNEGFRMNKSMLESLNKVADKPEINTRIEKARGEAFEGIFTYIYEAIKVPVYADAFQKIINEAEAG